MDAYIRSFVLEKIKDVIDDTEKPLSKELSEYIKELLGVDVILQAARKYDLMEKVESAFRQDFEKKSFQGTWKISNYMRMVNYENVYDDIAKKANINEKTLRESIEKYTQRRHTIVHSGDYSLDQSPPKENKIGKTYAKDCIKLVQKIATGIHELSEGN